MNLFGIPIYIYTYTYILQVGDCEPLRHPYIYIYSYIYIAGRWLWTSSASRWTCSWLQSSSGTQPVWCTSTKVQILTQTAPARCRCLPRYSISEIWKLLVQMYNYWRKRTIYKYWRKWTAQILPVQKYKHWRKRHLFVVVVELSIKSLAPKFTSTQVQILTQKHFVSIKSLGVSGALGFSYIY